MMKTVLGVKLHRPRVTDANLKYMGSITIDQDILDYSSLNPYEKVLIVDINNGQRFETYIISGKRGSKTICLNGAAARLVQPGDEIIIMSFVQIDQQAVKQWQPTIVLFDEANNIIEKT